MKRLHVLILLIVLLVLALFALRVDNKVASPPQSSQNAPISAPDAPPSGSAGREEQVVGTTGLPHAPGGGERP